MNGKLVRDNIPEIIRDSGEEPTTTVLGAADYLTALDKKLQEEVDEYQESKDLNELADVLEVVRAILVARNSSYEQIEKVRIDKLAERGGFNERIFLEQ